MNKPTWRITPIKMTDKNPQKSLFKIKMENEARIKEHTEKEQIKELNRALIQGLDLNKAANSIFGPGPDKKSNEKDSKIKLKTQDVLKFNNEWKE